MNLSDYGPAPALDVSAWVGRASPLASLRGRVVLVEVFQMLCPGCVTHALPQAQRVQRAFPGVAVLGLHSVFEHHEAMQPASLDVFLSEYRIDFPVGIDRHDGMPQPVTLQRYGLPGTPSTLLIDKRGHLRLAHFGAIDDLALGFLLGYLEAEEYPDGDPDGDLDGNARGNAIDEPTGVPESGPAGALRGSAASTPTADASAVAGAGEVGSVCVPGQGCS